MEEKSETYQEVFFLCCIVFDTWNLLNIFISKVILLCWFIASKQSWHDPGKRVLWTFGPTETRVVGTDDTEHPRFIISRAPPVSTLWYSFLLRTSHHIKSGLMHIISLEEWNPFCQLPLSKHFNCAWRRLFQCSVKSAASGWYAMWYDLIMMDSQEVLFNAINKKK